jgi:serine phosphatase RsbU (regulator of sigma subunit)
MSDLVHPGIRESSPAGTRGIARRIPSPSFLGKNLASNGVASLPFLLVVAAIAAVAYADHLVVVPSLLYLYILPLTLGAVFLRKEVSYGLIAVCILFHCIDSPRQISLTLRVFHDLSALVCFTLVVFVIHRYARQQQSLLKTVERQRDDLLKDVELAAQVQRLFLPSSSGKPVIAGLDIAGMMHPARVIGGDYYDFFSVAPQTAQTIIADVSGKGVPAALLMSATAAALRLEANRDRSVLEQVRSLNAEICAVSDPEQYVTLLVAEIDTQQQVVRYVNCGHNSALLFRAKSGTLSRMNSSCPPIGLFPQEICGLACESLADGDVLLFYTDGVTEAENRQGEEFGIERLSATVQRGASLSADDLMADVYNAAADFCGDNFNDDVTILVVKCDFDSPSAPGA